MWKKYISVLVHLHSYIEAVLLQLIIFISHPVTQF